MNTQPQAAFPARHKIVVVPSEHALSLGTELTAQEQIEVQNLLAGVIGEKLNVHLATAHLKQILLRRKEQEALEIAYGTPIVPLWVKKSVLPLYRFTGKIKVYLGCGHCGSYFNVKIAISSKTQLAKCPMCLANNGIQLEVEAKSG